MKNEASVKQSFNQAAQKYDQERRKLIPCYDDFYQISLTLLDQVQIKQDPRILDLGAGTGLFTSYFLEKYPTAQFTLIDFSDKMLELAKQRFANHDHITYILGDYSTYTFEQRFDLVISSLSIHHLSDEEKRALFQHVYSLLDDQGIFINADQAKGATPVFDAWYKASWEAAINSSGLAAEAIKASIERRKLDQNAFLHDQLAWLREAGFRHVDCIYKYFDFAVFWAQKTTE